VTDTAKYPFTPAQQAHLEGLFTALVLAAVDVTKSAEAAQRFIEAMNELVSYCAAVGYELGKSEARWPR
jgi:hypothetical protein